MSERDEKLRIYMQKIDGAWFITSPDLKEVCAATAAAGFDAQATEAIR